MKEEMFKLGNISVEDFEKVVRTFGFDSPVATAVWNTMYNNPNNQEEFEEVYKRWSAGWYTSDQSEKKCNCD